jgi:MFS family permease
MGRAGHLREWLATSARASVEVWRQPNLRRAELSWGMTWTAEWAFTTALGVYAFRVGGAEAVGAVGFVRLLPAALSPPFAGTLADRIPRERILAASGLIRAAATGLAAVAAAVDAPAAYVYALALTATMAFTVYRPAHSALLPSLCHTPDQLTSANGTRALLDGASALAGPLLAGGLLELAAVEVSFGASAVASIYSTLLIARIRYEPPPLPQAPRRRIVSELIDGVRALADERHATLLVVLGVAQAVVRGALNVFLVVLALDLLDIGAGGVGLLAAAFGLGGLLGGAGTFLLVGSPRLAAFFGLGISLWGAPMAVIGAAPSTPGTLALLALVGLGNALVDTTTFTLLQRLVPDRVLARMLGVAEMLWTIAIALGSLATPALISLLNERGALIAVGSSLPALVVVSWAALRRIDARISVLDEEIALLSAVPMLRPLPVPALEHLASRLERISIPAGEFVFREGDLGNRFYVVAEGEAEVLGAGKPLRTLSRGDSFGEIALLRAVRRTASVRALDTLDLHTLDGEAFLVAVSGYSSSSAAADATVANRLAAYRPAGISV